MFGLKPNVCMEFDVVLLQIIVVSFTDFRHFEGSNMLGPIAILTECVFPSTRSADPVFDLGTLPFKSSSRMGQGFTLQSTRGGI
jgi:hypothetical protein